MYKYLGVLALGLCACSSSMPLAQNTAPVAPPPVSAVPAAHAEVTLTPVAEDTNAPVNVELSNGRRAQALHCSSELDCLTKLAGVCGNGYNGGQMLSDGTHTVGILFRCVSDEEKAQAAEQARQEAEWEAARQAQVKAALEAAQKKNQPKK